MPRNLMQAAESPRPASGVRMAIRRGLGVTGRSPIVRAATGRISTATTARRVRRLVRRDVSRTASLATRSPTRPARVVKSDPMRPGAKASGRTATAHAATVRRATGRSGRVRRAIMTVPEATARSVNSAATRNSRVVRLTGDPARISAAAPIAAGISVPIAANRSRGRSAPRARPTRRSATRARRVTARGISTSRGLTSLASTGPARNAAAVMSARVFRARARIFPMVIAPEATVRRVIVRFGNGRNLTVRARTVRNSIGRAGIAKLQASGRTILKAHHGPPAAMRSDRLGTMRMIPRSSPSGQPLAVAANTASADLRSTGGIAIKLPSRRPGKKPANGLPRWWHAPALPHGGTPRSGSRRVG